MKRDIEITLKNFVDNDQPNKRVLLVEGARQVGKTFLIESFLKDVNERAVISLNLEKDRVLRRQLDELIEFEDFEALLLRHYDFRPDANQILFIDEAQESPTLGSFVRFMKERWSRSTVILTGSSMTRLFGEGRVPVGRVEYLRVFPFSFREFLRAQEKEISLDQAFKRARQNTGPQDPLVHEELLDLYDNYLTVGGLPEVVKSFVAGEDPESQARLRMEIYLSQQDDFYRKQPAIKSHLFDDAITAIARSVGLPFSLTNVTQNHRDAKEIMTLLEAWHLALCCRQESLTPTTTSFHPKYYLYDVGLIKQLRESVQPKLSLKGTTAPTLRTNLGGLVEAAIFLSLQNGKGFLDSVVGWKKGPKHQIEVDFVIKSRGNPIPIEVKVARRFGPQHGTNVRHFLREAGLQTGIVVSTAPFEKAVQDELSVINVPVYLAEPDFIREIASNN